MADSRDIGGWVILLLGIFFIIPATSDALNLGLAYLPRMIMGIVLLAVGILMRHHKKH